MPYKTTDVTLQPCPYCASEDLHYSANGPDGHLFWCGNCGALGPNEIDFYNAAKMWNLRRSTDDLLAACEALVGRWEHDHTEWDRKTQSFPPYDPKLDCEEVKQARAAITAARGNAR